MSAENFVSSWPELVQDYEKENRATLPPKQTSLSPLQPDELLHNLKDRMNEAERKSLQPNRMKQSVVHDTAELNPVTMRYLDRDLEDQMSERESFNAMKKVNAGKAVALERDCEYDFINHLSHIPGKGDVEETWEAQEKKQKDHPRGYNIVTNLEYALHHYDHPEKRPKSCPEGNRNADEPSKSHVLEQKRTLANRQRDFNIVSNRYVQHHEAKLKYDDERTAVLASTKQHRATLYNPVTCQVNEEGHPDALRKLESAEMHGRRMVSHQQTSTDPFQLSSEPSSSRRAKGGMLKSTVEKNINDKSVLATDRNLTRAVNRCTTQRKKILSRYSHGYNIITND